MHGVRLVAFGSAAAVPAGPLVAVLVAGVKFD